MKLRILYQDSDLVIVDKPAGFHVHPPEDQTHRISRNTNCLLILSKQLERYVYPIHRLDRATSGVLVFALTQEAARDLNNAFRERKVRKTYVCVTRGWVPEKGEITQPIGENEALTTFEKLAHLELPHAIGKYPTARYSLVRVWPHTGRTHQIRRHFAHLAHPLIGDTLYGDRQHNRLFKETLALPGLFLKAHTLEFLHPKTSVAMCVDSRWSGAWHTVFDRFGICPLR
jgi:tRNA pseudouridine65 synthase